jgi:hypothetical protein
MSLIDSANTGASTIADGASDASGLIKRDAEQRTNLHFFNEMLAYDQRGNKSFDRRPERSLFI